MSDKIKEELEQLKAQRGIMVDLYATMRKVHTRQIELIKMKESIEREIAENEATERRIEASISNIIDTEV